MNAKQNWCPGVIEGFFGLPWSWQARSDYAGFLAAQGFSSYIYAPKNDSFLRRRWHQGWPPEQLEQLVKLSRLYQAASVDFGIGLSPFELYLDFSDARKLQLARKLDEINAIAPTILCLLFDDMTGSLTTLASKQLEIMDFVTARSTARHFILCPTYYSSDPRLARLFGSPPQAYLRELGQGLDQSIDMFWTGPQIISRQYPPEHLQQVSEQINRKPVLWDNYPVNDAQRLTNFLHLLPFTRRDPQLQELCAGHYANPMNQPYLSQLPLYTLPRLYAGASQDTDLRFRQACAALCPPELAAALQEDAGLFQHQGLDCISSSARTALVKKYTGMPHPMAAEIVLWLQGVYAFDPNCLT